MKDARVPDVLDVLAKYAATFDQISDEADARYSASSFVRWVQLETRAVRDGERSDGLPDEAEQAPGKVYDGPESY